MGKAIRPADCWSNIHMLENKGQKLSKKILFANTRGIFKILNLTRSTCDITKLF